MVEHDKSLEVTMTERHSCRDDDKRKIKTSTEKPPPGEVKKFIETNEKRLPRSSSVNLYMEILKPRDSATRSEEQRQQS